MMYKGRRRNDYNFNIFQHHPVTKVFNLDAFFALLSFSIRIYDGFINSTLKMKNLSVYKLVETVLLFYLRFSFGTQFKVR